MDPYLIRSVLKTNATESKFQVELEIHLNCSSGRDSKETERTQSYKLLVFKTITYNLISSKIMAGWLAEFSCMGVTTNALFNKSKA